MQVKIFSKTDKGQVRANNQDTFRLGMVSENLLWSVVCDGMGGVKGGNIASSLVADCIENILKAELNENMSDEEMKSLVFKCTDSANSEVFSKSIDELDLRGMGTTVVLIIISKGKAFLAHVGDSRAYLLRENNLEQITKDHSLVQDLVDMGEITAEEAKRHPRRNIITRCVGVRSTVQTDYKEVDVQKGDIILSCSDGLSNYLSDEIVKEYCEKYQDQELVDELVNFANNSGGSDNITVSIIYI